MTPDSKERLLPVILSLLSTYLLSFWAKALWPETDIFLRLRCTSQISVFLEHNPATPTAYWILPHFVV